MNYDQIIDLIHTGIPYGILIETGVGMPLTQKLLSRSGASKTVYYSECPYDRTIQEKRYGIPTDVRSVSLEVAQDLAYRSFMDHIKDKPELNFAWSMTFQHKSDGCSHGWTSLLIKESNIRMITFHITLPMGKTRQEAIELISQIGLKAIYHYFKLGDQASQEWEYVDAQFESYRDWELEIHGFPKHVIWVHNPKGDWERLETFFRQDEPERAPPLLIFKGSFNPIHEGHIEMATISQTNYPRSKFGMMLSLNTYQKGLMSKESLFERIRSINKCGYHAIVSDRGMFAENIEDFQQRFPNQKLVFVIGWDTYVRMEDDLFSVPGVNYLLFDREKKAHLQDAMAIRPNCQLIEYDNPISSTQIRKKMKGHL